MEKIRAAAKASKAATLKRYTGGDAAHADEAADRALIKRMVKPEARAGHADGGASRKPKGSKINVVIAPRGQDRPVPVPVPVSGAASPAGIAPSQSPPAPSAGRAPMRVMPLSPPQGPLGPLPAKHGGSIRKRADGGAVKFTGGAESGIGRLEKVSAQRRGR